MRVPQVRFKGFSDEWEEKELQSFSNYHSSTLSVNDALASGRYCLYDANSIIGYTDKNIQSEDYITIIKDGSGVGRVRLLPKNTSFISTMGAITARDADLYFVFTVLCLSNFSQFITGATIPHIYYSNYGKKKYYIPKELEQTKIGNFFKDIDKAIALEEQKYTKLMQMKKALLEKMFPKEGAQVPEIRFQGFSDTWTKENFEKFAKVLMNKRIFKHQTSEKGDIPFFKIGTFGGVADAFISKELFEEYKNKYPYPQKGDILLSASGSIGRIVEYSGKDEYFQDSNIVWLEHKRMLDNNFLQYFYAVVNWYGLEGSTIKRLYNKNILATKITYPNKTEQTNIGELFKTIDKRLTLQQAKIEKLQNVKKALLEKMFV